MGMQRIANLSPPWVYELPLTYWPHRVSQSDTVGYGGQVAHPVISLLADPPYIGEGIRIVLGSVDEINLHWCTAPTLPHTKLTYKHLYIDLLYTITYDYYNTNKTVTVVL